MENEKLKLPEWEDPRHLLQRYGRSAKRFYSQNFLVNRGAAETIARAAVPNSGETVIELGAGLGHLTWYLLRREARVVAIDVDTSLLDILRERFAGCETLKVVQADATQVVFSELAAQVSPSAVRVAGNIPYALTGKIIRNLNLQASSFASAVLMVQREVSQRLRAQPGNSDYGLLSVFVQANFAVERVLELAEGSFYPSPKVRSEVVRLVPLASPRATIDEHFSGLVRQVFQQRRKTLLNTLARVTGSKPLAQSLADSVCIDAQSRPETLSVEDFDRLARSWSAMRVAR